jgi:hypothetical protein
MLYVLLAYTVTNQLASRRDGGFGEGGIKEEDGERDWRRKV